MSFVLHSRSYKKLLKPVYASELFYFCNSISQNVSLYLTIMIIICLQPNFLHFKLYLTLFIFQLQLKLMFVTLFLVIVTISLSFHFNYCIYNFISHISHKLDLSQNVTISQNVTFCVSHHCNLIIHLHLCFSELHLFLTFFTLIIAFWLFSELYLTMSQFHKMWLWNAQPEHNLAFASLLLIIVTMYYVFNLNDCIFNFISHRCDFISLYNCNLIISLWLMDLIASFWHLQLHFYCDFVSHKYDYFQCWLPCSYDFTSYSFYLYISQCEFVSNCLILAVMIYSLIHVTFSFIS